jgi:hypothetical protein
VPLAQSQETSFCCAPHVGRPDGPKVPFCPPPSPVVEPASRLLPPSLGACEPPSPDAGPPLSSLPFLVSLFEGAPPSPACTTFEEHPVASIPAATSAQATNRFDMTKPPSEDAALRRTGRRRTRRASSRPAKIPAFAAGPRHPRRGTLRASAASRRG